MFKSLVPKNEIFYELFNQISTNTVEGVQALVKMLDDCEHYNEYAVSLKSLEHQTDLLVHSVMSHLHKTFVTPIDRRHPPAGCPSRRHPRPGRSRQLAHRPLPPLQRAARSQGTEPRAAGKCQIG